MGGAALIFHFRSDVCVVVPILPRVIPLRFLCRCQDKCQSLGLARGVRLVAAIQVIQARNARDIKLGKAVIVTIQNIQIVQLPHRQRG